MEGLGAIGPLEGFGPQALFAGSFFCGRGPGCGCSQSVMNSGMEVDPNFVLNLKEFSFLGGRLVPKEQFGNDER